MKNLLTIIFILFISTAFGQWQKVGVDNTDITGVSLSPNMVLYGNVEQDAGFTYNPTTDLLDVKNINLPTTSGSTQGFIKMNNSKFMHIGVSSSNTFAGLDAGQANASGSIGATAFGSGALYNNTTGGWITAVGNNAGRSNVTGSESTYVGYYAGYGYTTNGNTIVGAWAGYAPSSAASNNTLIGFNTGRLITSGSHNIIMGAHLNAPTTTNATGSILLGQRTGDVMDSIHYSIFIGNFAGYSIKDANINGPIKRRLIIASNTSTTETADSILIYGDFGADTVKINGGLRVRDYLELTKASTSNTSGVLLQNTVRLLHTWKGTTTTASVFLSNGTNVSGNFTATGVGANVGIGGANMTGLTTGNQNVGLGYRALQSVTTGGSNVAIGTIALPNITDAIYNVALGANTLEDNVSGDQNTALGALAGNWVTGDNNTLIGYMAGNGGASGNSVVSGTQNTLIGAGTDVSSNTISGSVGIGYDVNITASNQLKIDNSNTATPLIQGDFSANTLTVNGGMTVSGTTSYLMLPVLTTTQRNALTPADGMIIYNSTDGKFQGRAGGAWVDFH